MTKSSKPSRQPSKGDELEWRVGRLYFWNGFFARTGVDLKEHFHPEPLQITDLDLLAYDISELLTFQKVIGETKSGTGRSAPKVLDRIFWLAGLKEFTGADRAILVVAKKSSPDTRSLGQQLGVRVLSESELGELEKSAGIVQLDYGSFAREFMTSWTRVRPLLKGDHALDRAWKFLRADVWHQDPWTAVKRCMSLLQRVRKERVETQPAELGSALDLLLVEGSVVFTLLAVRIAGLVRWLPPDEGTQMIHQRLAEGLATFGQLEQLSQSVDRHVSALLQQVNAPHSLQIEAMGAFAPRPPTWTAGFTELVLRFAQEPRLSKPLPRLMDVVLYENVIGGRVISSTAINALHLESIDGAHRLARLTGKFLETNAGVPAEMFRAFGLTVGDSSSAASQPSLLDRKSVEPPPEG